mgnify:FL=1
MSKTQKFTSEELEQIKTLRDQNREIVQSFGQLEMEILLTKKRVEVLTEEKEKTISKYENLQEEEQNLVKQLNTKYGAGTVDIVSGEFTPAK